MLTDITLNIYLADTNKYKELVIYGNIKLLLSDVMGFKKIKTYAFVDLDNLVSTLDELEILNNLIISTYGYAVRYTMSANNLMKLTNDRNIAEFYDKTVNKKDVTNKEYTLTHLNSVLESLGVYIELKESLLSNKLRVSC